MKDLRMEKLAYNLVNYSIEAKKGDKVLVEAHDVDSVFICEIVKQIYKAGAHPFVETFDKKIDRAILHGTSEEHMQLMTKYALHRMQDMDCYIGVRGGKNSYEGSDIPADKMEVYSKIYGFPVHHETRVCKTRWVVLRYPNDSMSQLACMPTEKFEDYYFDVCNLDYAKMDKAMDPLIALMNKTDKVRLVAKNTDLTFSIKGIGGVKCSGKLNIPDGEIYTAPVKNSVNGVICYNTPSIKNGLKHENITLTFKDGKIIRSEGNYTEELKKIFSADEGASYVGEFAIGVNPFINVPMCDTLFDEKIAGSIHFTPGCAYDDAFNGNKSSLHWDLVLIMTPEYGGGEIWFDDKLIRKDGRFVIPELFCLNPENLK